MWFLTEYVTKETWGLAFFVICKAVFHVFKHKEPKKSNCGPNSKRGFYMNIGEVTD